MNTAALIRLWNLTQEHDAYTSGARRAALVLLGLYNGPRFPFDLTDLRAMDTNVMEDAISVIAEDSRRCQREVHMWLNHLTGRGDFGERFEHLAHKYRVKGRCKKEALFQLSPETLVIKHAAPPAPQSNAETASYGDVLHTSGE